jgi:tetratricopeptide (TPR) repeat protein
MLPAPDETRWHARVKEVFLEAADLTPGLRGEHLASACAGESALLREVDRLLAAFDEADGTFSGTGPGAFLADRSERRTFVPNDKVDRFTIARLLGIGGMGEVYEVSDSEFGERLALKTLRPELAVRADAAGRFRREIQLARRITHSNVCRIYDVGYHEAEGNGRWYFTMELLDGHTMAERLRTGHLPLPEVIAVFRQIASGVAALHQAGIVHRDIKPANVIFADSPAGRRAVITDFGVAQVAAGGAPEDLTATGHVIGTIKYMAPEQLGGNKVGPEADVFALGITMYEALRGSQRPAAGGWHKVVAQDLRRPGSGRRPPTETRLLKLLLRCVEIEPKNRLANAGEILDWLDSIENTPHGLLRRPRAQAVGPAHWIRAHRLSLCAGLAVLSAIAVTWPFARTPLLLRACGVFPGSAWACQLPAERDIAVFPFKITAADPSRTTLGSGYAAFLRTALLRLYPDPGSHCLHLRNDYTGDGVRLVLEGELRPLPNEMEVSLTVRDSWAAAKSPSVIRRIRLRIPLNAPERLATEPLQAIASALQLQWGAGDWPAWTAQESHDGPAFLAYLRGLGQLQNKQYEDAIATLKEPTDLKRDFSFAPAHVALARAYRMNGEPDHARQEAARAHGDSDFFGAERELGEIEAAARRPREAIQHFTAALRSWAHDEASVKGLAAAQEAAGDDNGAEATYRSAIGRAPRCWLTYNAMADYYSRHSRYEKAEDELMKAIQATPRNASLYHNLAFDYTKRGRYDDAIQMASTAAELSPAALIYTTLGTAYLYRGCADAAGVNLRYATSLEPDYWLVWANLGHAMALWRPSRAEAETVYRRAVETARRTVQQNPGHVRAWSQLAVNLARLGEFNQAFDAIGAALRLGRSEEAFLAAAQVDELAGRRDEAFHVLDDAFQKGISIYQARAATNLERLRADPKFAAMVRAHGLDPNSQAQNLHRRPAQSCPVAPVPGKGF